MCTHSDEDLSNSTKALTQGTEDIDDENVGHIQDPCTSIEASAKGTSTKHAETTFVMLESTPHETQTEPHSSLPLTPRLPMKGKPSACKQEVADSVMTAGCTNRTVELAEPTKTDTDIDRMTLLGGEPAEKVCGVDEGNWMECESKLQLQQTKLLCKEDDQHSGNANRDLPITNGLPLEGEWSVYVSSELRDSKGDTSMSNAAVEHADGSDGQTKLISVEDLELESRESGMVEREHVDTAETAVLMPAAECCEQLGMADGDASHGTRPADMSNELTEFVAVLIELEGPDDGGMPRVCLGGTQMQPGDMNGPGIHTDGIGSQMGMSTGHVDVSSVEMDPNIPANKMESVSTRCHAPNTFGTVNMEHTIDLSLSWSK